MKNNSLIVTAVTAAAAIVIAGCQKKQEAQPGAPVTPPASAPRIVSAERTSFDQVTAKLDKGGNVYLYLSTEQALLGLSNRLTAASNFVSSLPAISGDGRENLVRLFGFLNGFVIDSGVSEISGLGVSSIAREKGFYYGKLVLHHYPGENAGVIWSLFGKAPHRMDGLDLLPQSTALAIFSDFDFTLAWAKLQDELASLNIPGVDKALKQFPAQFHEKTGLELDDVLKSLGGEYGLIFTLDEHKKITLPLPNNPLEIPSPGLAIVVKVNSDLVFDRVADILEKNQVTSKLVSKVDDTNLKMRTMNVPLPIPLDLRPSLARSGDYLLVASSDTLVREILAVKSGEAKGYKATAEFKKLSQDIPDQGNNFALVTGAFASTMAQVQQKALANQPGGAERAQSLQDLLNSGTNSFSYSVGVNGSEGWEGFANSSHNLQALIAPAAVAGGVAAALAIPAYAKAHTGSKASSQSQ
jgi:hypothetical protein